MQRHRYTSSLTLLCSVALISCDAPKPPPPPPPPPAKAAAPEAPAEAPSAPREALQAGKALSLNPHPKATAGDSPVAAAPDAAAAPPDPYREAMQRAIEARQKSDARAAEVEYRAALKATPKDPLALAGVAEMLFAQDKTADALQPAELAYELAPKEPEVRWVFGLVMLAKNKRTDDAIAAWEAIIKDTPDYAQQLGLAERLKVIKTYTKGVSHGGTKTPPGGPSSAPSGPSSAPSGPSSAPAPK